ncbi:MAG: heme exporter protein CcmB [Bacteroidia bacterium]|nr:heme exporter protein CcmB [Bacteroidia bacterium]MBL4716344.1 heme exporter protein CcmB [Bacteroidia bacterium]
MFKEVKALILKDLKLEWRQKYALNGILLYVISTVFLCYLSFKHVDPITWLTLFWIIMLFTSVNAVAKSFLQESKGRMLYYYSISSSQSVIISKLIYNILLMLVLSVICLGFYHVVMGNPLENKLLFAVALILGSSGLASSFTMVSAIASKANNNTTLLAVLSFPIIIPLLVMLIAVSKNAMIGNPWMQSMDELITLLAINVIIVTVSYILFPYLWRE